MKPLLVVLLALAPLAASCGSDPASLEGSDDALKDASTSRIEWKIEDKGSPVFGFLRAAGVVDYAKSRGEIVIKGKNDSGPEARALFIDHNSYFGVKVNGTTYWLKESASDATGTDRFMPGPGGTSPERLLKDLIESSKKVENIGSDEIRGVPTTHYRAHLDRTRPGTGILEDEPGVVDAWIDQQGLPRRIRVRDGGEDEAAVEAVDLFDFGVAVDVEAPPSDQIVSEAKLDKIMEKECAGAEKDPANMNPLCLIFGESGGSLEGGDVSPTQTMPRKVSDY